LALRARGHEPVVLSRSTGVDAFSGEGLETALSGAQALIDLINTAARTPAEAGAFFSTETSNLLAAELRAGIQHHVLVSIVGLERLPASAHYAGKRRQEQVVRQGPVPWTILRASQFFEFAELMLRTSTRDGIAHLPPLLLQPVAAADVGKVLAELAVGPPLRQVLNLTGPEPQDLVDMARRILNLRGEQTKLVPSWRSGRFGVEAAGEMFLADPDARIAPTTFEEWLRARQAGD
jgi:uncharacterized protein YbjT (DUF2867 family)